MIQPPSSGPITGATSVVIDHIAIAMPAARLRIARQQQRLRQRDHRPGDAALQRAEDDQHRHVRRQAAQPRGDDEQQHAGDEQPHLPEALRQPAGQRHRDRIGHREAGDDPGALVRAHAEVAGDGRQRHVGDRRVEHVHERRERQRDRAQHAAPSRPAADARRCWRRRPRCGERHGRDSRARRRRSAAAIDAVRGSPAIGVAADRARPPRRGRRRLGAAPPSPRVRGWRR